MVPNNILAGFLLLAVGTGGFGLIETSSERLGNYVYHLLAIVFIAMTLRKAENKGSKSTFALGLLMAIGTGVQLIIGLVILFPCGFVFSADSQRLPPALQSIYFIPHVAVYMFAYILLTKAAIIAAVTLLRRGSDPGQIKLDEAAAYRITGLGVPLLTLGLVLGSIWAKAAWGYFWGWDPKELWSLVTVLVYMGYFHFRYTYAQKYPRANCVWIIAGFVCIVITLLWVNLSNIFAGMHNYA